MQNVQNEIKAILLDIEGTTSDILFVKNVLFPYARDNCENFLNQHFESAEIQKIIDDLVELSQRDQRPIIRSDNQQTFVKSVVENVHWQISEDRKTKELKNLQGKIWKIAFESGEIKGHVYEDVPRKLKEWTEAGFNVFIYSSGSVEAQKLLFGHSEYGNLLEFLSGHFDTNVGHKQEVESYRNIAKEIGLSPSEVLFLSDIPNEVIAAENAGMKTAILDRPNNPTILDDEIRKRFKIVKNFDEIEF